MPYRRRQGVEIGREKGVVFGCDLTRHVQRFLATHDQITNVFSRQPLATATERRSARTQAFTHWADVTGVAMAV